MDRRWVPGRYGDPVITVGADPRVLVVSHDARPDGLPRMPGYVAFSEAADVLASTTGADVASLRISPTSPSMRVRRIVGRRYRQAAGRGRQLPTIPGDERAATADRPLAGRYDLLVFVAVTEWDLPLLERLHHLRRRADRVAVWFPEVWPRDFLDRRLALEPFGMVDDLYVGVADSAPLLAGVAGAPATYLPMAVDVVRFAPDGLDIPRPVDVLGIGRRLPRLHDALLDWSRRSGRYYVYDTVDGGEVLQPRAHRQNLAALYRRSNVAVTHYAKFDQPERIGDQREIPGRLWEGLAAGTVMAGMPPSESLQRQRPGAPVVKPLPDDPAEAVALLDELCRRPDESARRRNLHLALTANDWGHRWATVFERAGLPVPSNLRARLDHLAERAEALDRVV